MAYNDFIGSEHFCWLAVALGVWCGAMVVPFRKISLRFRKFRVAVNMVPNEFIIFLFVQGCMETTSLETEDLLHVVLAIVPIIWDLYMVSYFLISLLSALSFSCKKQRKWSVIPSKEKPFWLNREYFTCLSLQTAY